MNTNANFATVWRYGIHSAPASLYPVGLFVFALVVFALVGLFSGHASDAKSGQVLLIILTASIVGMAGYLINKFAHRADQVAAGANLTPVFPGFFWLMIGLMSLAVSVYGADAIQAHVQFEQAKGFAGDDAAKPVFAMPVYGLAVMVGIEVVVLLVYFVQDILIARSGLPVDMNVTNAALGSGVAPGRAMAPVPRAEQTPLATRDTEALKPKLTFAQLAGNEELKKKLLAAAVEWDNAGKKNGKNGIFLYGEPGTGKTAFAEALAGEVGLKIMKVNVGSMASRWINQTTEQLQDIIDSALRQAPCVLFLDEVEAIFPDRSRIERGDSEESKVVGSFLSSVEKLRDGRVLLIAATNYKDRVDAAAIREGRFDFHIEVAVPDFEARKGLVMGVLSKSGKLVEPAVLDRLARRWAGFNVPRIQEAARRAAGFSVSNTVEMRDFMRGLRDVQGNKAGVSESALSLTDLHFDDALKDRLVNLATTFSKSDEIEARGGSVPKGVIFYGPPGTGKTTMAQALAKEAGWAFIATSGKEILSDANKLREIRRKASDLRPAIVFIDEADDILGDRQFSGMKMHTNDLLRTIDGAGEPLHDVVWILATNDVDSLDEAVIRRFPTKIELPVPGLDTLRKLVHDWAAKRPDMVAGGPDSWSADVAAALEGLAPSVVKNILDAALNNEAANSVVRGEAMHITVEDVLFARREMRV